MGFLSRLFRPNIQKLAEKGDIDALVGLLETGPSTELRVEALVALAAQPGERPTTVLVAALESDDPALHDAAASALRGRGPTAAAALAEGLAADSGERALEILLDVGDAAVESLKHALQSPSDAARRLALRGIRELGRRLDDDEVREFTFRCLLAALGDRSPECRVDAAVGLEELCDARACRALAAQLKDGDGQVRAACARALQHIGETAVPSLAEALADRNANARRLAAVTLGIVCSDNAGIAVRAVALEALLGHVGDSDGEVRDHSLTALRKIPATDVVSDRLELLADPDRSDREELRDFVLDLIEHAEIEPGLRAATRHRIQALGLSIDAGG